MKELTILVTYITKPGMRGIFLDEILESGVLEQIRAEDGCLGYDYFCAADEENRLLLVEKWTSEGHQKRHMQQPHMEKLKAVKDRYVDSTQIRFLYEK